MTDDAAHLRELAPQYAVMGFLYFEPLHGYELHRRLETNLREVWRIPQNQAYNLLKRLEREGLVESSRQDQPPLPPRSLFQLTPLGRQQFEAWLYSPSPCSVRALRIEFLTRMFFACQISEDLPVHLMQEQETAIRAALEKLEQRMAAIPEQQVFNRLSLDLRIRQLAMLSQWLETCEPNFFA